MTAWAIVATLLLVVVNAWFVAWEFALVASHTTKLEALAEDGSRRASLALAALERRSRHLVGAQLAITVASLALGVLTEPGFARLVEPVVELFGDPPDSVVHAVALVVAFVIVAFLHMVLGEMVPKGLALAGPERALLALAPVNTVFGALCRPVTWFVDTLATAVMRAIRLSGVRQPGTAHTAAEFVAMLDASRDRGMLDESEHTLLAGALDFRSRVAAAVMVPRERVVYVNRRMTVGSIERVAHRSGHSRLPVVGTGLDNVIGFIHVKDLLRLPPEARDEPVPLELIRRMLVVPTDRPLEDVLRAMRRTRSHVALVRGPDNRTLGLVTLEDVLEALVGDIRDESDRDVSSRGVAGATAGSKRP
ncbi:MAG TPA: hemolysin family protein [Acidimicrobiales bacterium]